MNLRHAMENTFRGSGREQNGQIFKNLRNSSRTYIIMFRKMPNITLLFYYQSFSFCTATKVEETSSGDTKSPWQPWMKTLYKLVLHYYEMMGKTHGSCCLWLFATLWVTCRGVWCYVENLLYSPSKGGTSCVLIRLFYICDPFLPLQCGVYFLMPGTNWG